MYFQHYLTSWNKKYAFLQFVSWMNKEVEVIYKRIDAQINDITTQMALASRHVMNLCLASSPTIVGKNMSHSKYVFVLKSSPKATYRPLHANETPLHETEDNPTYKTCATTLHFE